ncbi:MAG: hypothetical protein ACI4UU_01215 [Clostridia bacterium]
MTNINCSEKCIYQKDGKCSFENVCIQKVNANNNCAYFVDIKTHCNTSKV